MLKNYNVVLKYELWQKRMWFAGEDDKETEQKWLDALRNLEKVGDSATSYQDFLHGATNHFESYGFMQIKM